MGLESGLGDYVLSQHPRSRGADPKPTLRARLHFLSDARYYRGAVEVLRTLDIHNVRIMANNPEKVDELVSAGVPALRVKNE